MLTAWPISKNQAGVRDPGNEVQKIYLSIHHQIVKYKYLSDSLNLF
jgi:hypothetical protein